jgi:hypothetical protein
VGPADSDVVHLPGCFAAVRQPAESLFVHEGDPYTGISEGIGQLGARPPRVQRDDYRPEQSRPPKRGDELRVVPHRDGHPVSLADTETTGQFAGQRERGTPDIGEGLPFIFEHEMIEGLVCGRHPEDVDDGPRRAYEGAQRNSIEDERLHLERCARADQHLQPLVGKEDICWAEASLFRSR